MTRVAVAIASLLALAAGAGAADDAAPPKAEAPTYAGEELCVACHEEAATSHAASPHRVLSDDARPEAQRGCEACHGPGGAHADEAARSGRAADLRGEYPVAARSAPLPRLSRRRPALHDAAPASTRSRASAVGLSSRPRGTDDLLRKTVPELCYGCHLDVRAKFALPEHHKVPEGVVTCLDCHERPRQPPLRADARQRRPWSLRTLSRRVQGPFVYEHGGCSSRGASVVTIRTAASIVICWFASRWPSSATSATPVTPSDHVQPSFRDCTRCHTAIHGSNFDSALARAMSATGGATACTRLGEHARRGAA